MINRNSMVAQIVDGKKGPQLSNYKNRSPEGNIRTTQKLKQPNGK